MAGADNMQHAESLVLHILRGEELPTGARIRTVVDSVLDMMAALSRDEGIDRGGLIRQVETKCSVFVPTEVTLDDPADHLEWLREKKGSVQWKFWDRYLTYLNEVELLPPQATRRLDEVTDQLLRRLEDPHRTGAWDRRGMVVGQVQSGKTANYTGLICKAADAGYHFIVVLAGLHNSLRSQTQRRLDRDFLGFDTQQRRIFDQSNTRIGVGTLLGRPMYIAHSLTNSAENGDFSVGVAQQANLMPGGAEPVLLVVKKNASVLRNLIGWATSVHGQTDTAHGRVIVRQVPLLVIDDEADNASVNTKADLDENGLPDPDLDPSKINGLIRKLLDQFEKTAYVGYTATPFANIFIADDMRSKRYGRDLFPSSFIINLSPPSNYLGPGRVFGMTADSAAGIQETAGLPIVREVRDYAEWVPDVHRKDLVPGPLPGSVREAIRAFVLTCAARVVRGATAVHNSMLIHVTRFISVQGHVARQVEEELEEIRSRLRYGDGASAPSLLGELRALWERDFLETTRRFPEQDIRQVTWLEVAQHLEAAAAKVEVRRINGSARDTLQYLEYPRGLSVICIGGDKLSRGLTLEGLSVSYYLRASRMYDTLMQMGRWFGYRPGYADLCRLYTTETLIDWYRDIAAADEELRMRFEDMAAQERTPMDYGLAIRNHPDGLMITAPNKMRHGERVYVSFSQTIIETISFYTDANRNQMNLDAAAELVDRIEQGAPGRSTDGSAKHLWSGVPGTDILDFLRSYTTHEDARKARSEILEKYIRSRVGDGELTEWAVALISNSQGPAARLGSCTVGLVRRAPLGSDPAVYRIRRLVSPADEWLDLTAEQKALALAQTQQAWRINPGRSRRAEEPAEPAGPIIRRIRPPTQGLLLLYPLDPESHEGLGQRFQGRPVVGFAISFPKSSHASQGAVEYTANRIFRDELFGGGA